MREGWIYRRGDIYIANLNPFRGSEQGETRPVLVLQKANASVSMGRALKNSARRQMLSNILQMFRRPIRILRQ